MIDLMDWTQAIAIIGSNLAFMLTMFLWLRSEANSDRRESHGLISAIHNEIKDFHGRLCAIEERNSNRK